VGVGPQTPPPYILDLLLSSKAIWKKYPRIGDPRSDDAARFGRLLFGQGMSTIGRRRHRLAIDPDQIDELISVLSKRRATHPGNSRPIVAARFSPTRNQQLEMQLQQPVLSLIYR
jgi:hypothetical protein